jgi:hypothetical protein
MLASIHPVSVVRAMSSVKPAAPVPADFTPACPRSNTVFAPSATSRAAHAVSSTAVMSESTTSTHARMSERNAVARRRERCRRRLRADRRPPPENSFEAVVSSSVLRMPPVIRIQIAARKYFVLQSNRFTNFTL